MKIFRFLTGLFLLSLPLNLHAQDVLYSRYQDYDFRSSNYSVVGKVNGKLYIYRSTPDGFFLDAYNDAMELQATVVLDFFPQHISETKFIVSGDKIIVLYQWLNDNNITQSAAMLDADARLLKGPLTLATERKGIFNSNRDFFSSAVSDDKSQIVVYGVSGKKKEINVKCIWVNAALEVKGRSNAEFVAENTLDYGAGMVDNNGQFYLPAYTPIGNKGFADQLWLLTLTTGERKFIPFELPINDIYVGNTYSKLDNENNRMYVGGFYSDKKNGNYEGVLYTYFDIATGKFENFKLIPFSEKMRNMAGEQNKRRAFNDFNIRQMIVKNDGGFIMVAEDYFVTTRNNYNSGFGGYYSWYYPVMSSSIREYHYGDILVMSYSAVGNPDWTSFIRKEQYSQEDGGLFSSYAPINTGGTLGFLFNDFNARRSRIQMASVDAEGKIDTRTLDAGRADDPDWLPRSSKQVGAREIVVPCLRKRQICFAKVIF